MTTTQIEEQPGSNKWFVLALSAITSIFVTALPFVCMPVLFKDIAAEMSLNLTQIGIIWGVTGFSSVFTLIMGGSLIDRYGARRSLFVVCILVGLMGASRGLSNNFMSLVATSFVFGMGASLIPLGCYKVSSTWFPHHQVGIANSIVTSSIALGFALAAILSGTLLAPLLGSWRYVLFLYGGISLVIGILWITIVKKPVHSDMLRTRQTSSIAASTMHILRNRQVWVLGFTMLGLLAAVQGTMGYLSLYLQSEGWSTPGADSALALMQIGGIVGALPLLLLSNSLGSRKKILLPVLIVILLGTGLLSILYNALVWPLVFLIGMGREGFMGISTTLNTEIEGVGPVYAGASIGLVQTIARFGGLIAPPLGNSLAVFDPGFPFLVWAGFCLIAIVSLYFVRDTGLHKSRI